MRSLVCLLVHIEKGNIAGPRESIYSRFEELSSRSVGVGKESLKAWNYCKNDYLITRRSLVSYRAYTYKQDISFADCSMYSIINPAHLSNIQTKNSDKDRCFDGHIYFPLFSLPNLAVPEGFEVEDAFYHPGVVDW